MGTNTKTNPTEILKDNSDGPVWTAQVSRPIFA